MTPVYHGGNPQSKVSCKNGVDFVDKAFPDSAFPPGHALLPVDPSDIVFGCGWSDVDFTFSGHAVTDIISEELRSHAETCLNKGSIHPSALVVIGGNIISS